MDKDKIISIVLPVVFFFIFVLLLNVIVDNTRENTRQEILKTIKTDTIFNTITLTDTVIQQKTKILYKTKVDTIIQIEYDSVIIEVPVEIPIEHKQYLDTITTDNGIFDIDVKYQGYKANIDSLNLNYRNNISYIKPKNKDWRQFVGIGISAGYGVTIPTGVFSPTIAVTLTYGFGYTFKK